MPFDLQWLLLALPVTFALGWAASRFDLRQMRREHRDTPRAYFKGLSLLLNEQQDKAIDAFIEAVQNDPDTAELHFALGNLFRRRGEFERAVRVHEHLLARADLKQEDRNRAQQALAQDFMRAGLFDRAEAAWRKLEGSSFDAEARLALLSLHERSRDWEAATEDALSLERRGAGSFSQRIAHYQCELALQADSRGAIEAADQALARAREAAPRAARPLVLTGQRQARAGRHGEALAAWDELRQVQPLAFNLVAREYAESARQAGRGDAARAALQEAYGQAPSMALMRAQSVLAGPDAADRPAALIGHLRQSPSLSAAQALLALPPESWGSEGLAALRTAVDRAARPVQRYRCAACGFEAQHWFWQCPGCLGWDSFPPQPVEEL
ncbi:MAG: lipopolysaccharide assembly protein LapB [Rubrivivax sp.]|nr:lipopolysaccharide assembly protein LapB [Rubrivivax sp.]